MTEQKPAVRRVLGLIHTVPSLMRTFDALVEELGGGQVIARHIVDEALLATTREMGLTKQTIRHLFAYALSAQESGAKTVLVTCSSVGPAVDLIAPLLDVPVVRVDEAMVDAALEFGRRVGVVATLESTLTPTVELVRKRAEALDAQIEVEVRLCDGAFERAARDDWQGHNLLVRDELRKLAPEVDVILLAQASMASATMPDETELECPVLSSPCLAVERALEALGVARG